MKILIIGKFHHKNESGLNYILRHLGWEFKYGTKQDIPNFDVICSPTNPINAKEYPNKKFIFGPHFSVFPTQKLFKINNEHKNCVYIQPSRWAADVWSYMGDLLPINPFPFPVNVDRFIPLSNMKRDKIFIYFKRRKPEELEFLKGELDRRDIQYVIFDYVKRYVENDYLQYLQQAKYGIILDAHESQGFAIEEALSCNTPLLVWCAQTMDQEYGSRYKPIPCTSVPYWDERCGEIFYKQEEFETQYDEFINKLDTYKPREYILENLGVEKCAENFKKLLLKI
jgi:hypothetical protein